MEENNESKSESALPVKVCGVCGDKALGYNFKAISCESCKAFFRRNALLSKEFKCPFREQCQITVITRRFCQKCRLEKCFAIGMSKDCIMSDEDRTHKRQKIAENKVKRRNNFKVGDDEVSSSKLIKREDDDSVNSDNSKQQSPNYHENHQNIEPMNNAHSSIYFDNTSGHNQAVSVIKNNNTSDSHMADSNSEQNRYNTTNKKYVSLPIEFGSNSESLPLASLQSHASLSFDHVISNGIQNHFAQAKLSNGQNSSDDKEDNMMIRSILTTSPPTEETSKLFAALTNHGQIHQPMCDKSLPSNTRGFQEKADVARDVLQDVERIQVEPKSMKLILCEAIKLEFETYTSLAQINSSSRELNDAERARLNELIVANKALLAPLDDYMTSLVNDECGFKPSQGQNDPMLLGIINLTAVAIKRLIKMAKKINAFKNMCEEDQVALLKGGCTEMMILRSTMTYDCARDTWKVPHSQESLSSIKAEVLKLAKGNIYQEHDRFVRTFDPKWRTDENIILIMSAIVLFTPNRPRVVHSDVIKLEQNSYYYLLRRYLESVYPGCEAKSTFLKLIQKIMELQKLAEEVIGVYLDVNPSHVEPLLIEIFDLKQQH